MEVREEDMKVGVRRNSLVIDRMNIQLVHTSTVHNEKVGYVLILIPYPERVTEFFCMIF